MRLSPPSPPLLLLLHIVHALVLLLLLISITTTEGVISDRLAITAQSTTTSIIRINRKEEEIKIMTASEEYEINKELDDMPLLPITSDETVRACRMLNSINPSHDIFICSYPKR